MHFGFALDSLDIKLWNIDLVDTYSDWVDTDPHSTSCLIPWRLEEMSSTSRRLQCNNFSSSKRSSKRLERRKVVTLKTFWRRVQDMAWRQTKVYWEMSYYFLKKGVRSNVRPIKFLS